MLQREAYIIEHDLDYRRRETLADAEQRRLARGVGIRRRTWLSCQLCRALVSLGRTMIAAGRRLEKRYAPAAA